MEQPLQNTEAAVEPTRKKRRKRRQRCKRHPKEGPHSPNCRGQKTAHTTNPNLVRTLPTLKPILDYLHISGEIFTCEEIMGHLIEYIKQKCLFDPDDPRKVYCKNDQLGVIFGCNEFSTSNACELLLRNLQKLNNPPPVKHKSHPFEWSACGVPTPWNSLSHGNKCQLPVVSTTDTCSCSESDQQSTNEACLSRSPIPSSSKIICKDRAGTKRRHSDACSDANQPVQQRSEPFYDIGYKICGYNSSLPSDNSEHPLGEYGRHYKHVCADLTDIVSDTSDDLFFLNETEEVALATDDDKFMEEYEPISYSDEERLIAASQQNQDDNSLDDTEDAGEDGGDELDNSDADSEIEEDDKWQCESCTERNHPMTRHCRRCWAMRKNWCPPTLIRSISDPVSLLQNDTRKTDQASFSDCATTSHTIQQEGDGYWNDKCYICQSKPRNGCIVHGQTGHQVCCVGCAKKLKEQGKPCPVCHRKIHRVIQNFL